MNKIKVIIEKEEEDRYFAFIFEGLKDHSIAGAGKTEIEAINDLHVALEEVRDMYDEDELEDAPPELIDLLFEYGYE